MLRVRSMSSRDSSSSLDVVVAHRVSFSVSASLGSVRTKVKDDIPNDEVDQQEQHAVSGPPASSEAFFLREDVDRVSDEQRHLRGGRVIDPANGRRRCHGCSASRTEVFRPLSVGSSQRAARGSSMPPGCSSPRGWIDAHAHLRDPGLTTKRSWRPARRPRCAAVSPRVLHAEHQPGSRSRRADRRDRRAGTGHTNGVHITLGTIDVGRRGLEELARRL